MREISRGTPSAAASPEAPTYTYPPGVVGYESLTIGAQHGIFAGPPSQCCFLGASATLTLQKPPAARTATFHFYVPKVQPYVDGGLAITIKVGGVSKMTMSKDGTQTIVVQLPATARDATQVPVQIVATPTFVPKALGINGDDRSLSALLLSVTYGA